MFAQFGTGAEVSIRQFCTSAELSAVLQTVLTLKDAFVA